jgi:hypothetical protein
MRWFTMMIAFLAWALWLGGMIALFVFVTTLFNGDRAIAVQAAPRMFVVFQKYQLILAAIELAAIVVWKSALPSKLIVAAFIVFAAAALAAVAVSIWILPRMEQLRSMGESSSPEFGRLHGISMMLYLAEVLFLLIGGIMLMIAMRAPRLERSTRIAEPTDSPA